MSMIKYKKLHLSPPGSYDSRSLNSTARRSVRMITNYLNHFIQNDIWPFIGMVTLVLLITAYVPSLLPRIYPISAWKWLEIYSTKRKQQYISDAAGLLKAGLSKVRHI